MCAQAELPRRIQRVLEQCGNGAERQVFDGHAHVALGVRRYMTVQGEPAAAVIADELQRIDREATALPGEATGVRSGPLHGVEPQHELAECHLAPVQLQQELRREAVVAPGILMNVDRHGAVAPAPHAAVVHLGRRAVECESRSAHRVRRRLEGEVRVGRTQVTHGECRLAARQGRTGHDYAFRLRRALGIEALHRATQYAFRGETSRHRVPRERLHGVHVQRRLRGQARRRTLHLGRLRDACGVHPRRRNAPRLRDRPRRHQPRIGRQIL